MLSQLLLLQLQHSLLLQNQFLKLHLQKFKMLHVLLLYKLLIDRSCSCSRRNCCCCRLRVLNVLQ